MKLNKKLHPKFKKEFLLDIALQLSVSLGYQNVRRKMIAETAGVANGLLYKYFGTMESLKKAIMHAAVERGIYEIIAQGLAARDPGAMRASEFIKQKAAIYLTN